LDDFDLPKLDLIWNSLRTPLERFYSLTERPGYLRLYLRKETLGELVTPSFLGRRQQDQSYRVTAALEFSPNQEWEEAGLVAIQSDAFHYRLVICARDGVPAVKLVKRFGGAESTLACRAVPAGRVYLQILAVGQSLDFYFGSNLGDLRPLYLDADGRMLSTDCAGGFVGTYLGVYASSKGEPSSNVADFDWFSYEGL
jgi:alpha-N-arabinofuranosidase